MKEGAEVTAKEELGQLYRLRENIDCLLERRRQTFDLAYKITSCNNGMPKGAGGDKVSNAAVILADLAAEIEEKTGEYERLQGEIAEKIGRIENRDYRLLLELRYLNFNRWHEISLKMNYSEKHIFYLHRNALRKYEEVNTI